MTSPKSASKPSPNTIRVSDLSQHHATAFDLRPAGDRLVEIRAELGLLALRKLTFVGVIEVSGKSDWMLKGRLGATIGQPCVVTLEMVTTRIEIPVDRLFLAKMPDIEINADLGEEIEMPGDETIEPLRKEIDLDALMVEALAISVPLYPKIKGANLDKSVFTEPGKQAMSDADTLPFAGLAALRGTLEKKSDDDSEEDI